MRKNIFKSQLVKNFCQAENFDYQQYFNQKVLEIKKQGQQIEQNLSQEKLELFQAGFDYLKQMSVKEKEYLWLKKHSQDKLMEQKYNIKLQIESFFDIEKESVWSKIGSQNLDTSQENSKQTEETKKEEEKTSFDVYLESFKPTDKLKIIKNLKQTMGTGLKDTKDFVEKTGEKQIKQGISKQDAEKLKEDLEKIGCVILIKQLIRLNYNGKFVKFWQWKQYIIKLYSFLNNKQKIRDYQNFLTIKLQIINKQLNHI